MYALTRLIYASTPSSYGQSDCGSIESIELLDQVLNVRSLGPIHLPQLVSLKRELQVWCPCKS